MRQRTSTSDRPDSRRERHLQGARGRDGDDLKVQPPATIQISLSSPPLSQQHGGRNIVRTHMRGNVSHSSDGVATLKGIHGIHEQHGRDKQKSNRHISSALDET